MSNVDILCLLYINLKLTCYCVIILLTLLCLFCFFFQYLMKIELPQQYAKLGEKHDHGIQRVTEEVSDNKLILELLIIFAGAA